MPDDHPTHEEQGLSSVFVNEDDGRLYAESGRLVLGKALVEESDFTVTVDHIGATTVIPAGVTVTLPTDDASFPAGGRCRFVQQPAPAGTANSVVAADPTVPIVSKHSSLGQGGLDRGALNFDGGGARVDIEKIQITIGGNTASGWSVSGDLV